MGTNVVQWSNLEDQVRYQPIDGIVLAPLILDIYPATAAYSAARLLRYDYSGALIRVRRSSDNAEQDIGHLLGELDTAALSTFCSGTNGYIRTVYDQQGSNDGIQTTDAFQPKIYDSVTGVELSNGKPSMRYEDDTKVLLTTSPLTIMTAKRHSTFAVVELLANTENNILSIFNTENWTLNLSSVNDTFCLYDGSWRTTVSRTVLTNQQYINILIRDSDTTCSNYLNGIDYTGRGCGDVTRGPAVAGIGRHPVAGTGAQGDQHTSEVIHYASDQTANLAAIRNNQNSFYGTY